MQGGRPSADAGEKVGVSKSHKVGWLDFADRPFIHHPLGNQPVAL